MLHQYWHELIVLLEDIACVYVAIAWRVCSTHCRWLWGTRSGQVVDSQWSKIGFKGQGYKW